MARPDDPLATPGPLAAELAAWLADAAAHGLARSLRPGAGVDFCTNDYLGLAGDPRLRAALLERLAPAGIPATERLAAAGMPATERLAAARTPATERLTTARMPGTARLATVAPPAERSAAGTSPPPAGVTALGAPASRLLRGHTEVHAALERRLAAWKGTEAALLFASGYQANVGLLSTLIAAGDRVLSDELNHASLIDGLRLARCRRVIYPHLDVAAVERELARPHAGGRTWLVTESLFSMDGDIAPLDVYASLAAAHHAELIVDDAHATGLFGDARGSGLCEHFAIERRPAAIVSTLGKAVGFAGAFVAGSRVLVDYLANRCRAFVFTTASPPLVLHAIDLALDLIAAEPERRRRVFDLAERLRTGLATLGQERPGGAGPIVPVTVGDNLRALELAEHLAGLGFDVRAVRPPTVPPGTARLRISIHASHTEADIDALTAALAAALAVPLAAPADAAHLA